MSLTADHSPSPPTGRTGTGPLIFANVMVMLAVVAQWVHAAVTGDLGFRGHVIGLDFVNTWTGARLALGGDVSALFDFAAYDALLQSQFGAGFPGHMWSYPPHLLPLIMPLGGLGYVPAYIIWCVITTLIFLWGAASTS